MARSGGGLQRLLLCHKNETPYSVVFGCNSLNRKRKMVLELNVFLDNEANMDGNKLGGTDKVATTIISLKYHRISMDIV